MAKPLKTKLAEVFSDGKAYSATKVFKVIEPEYPNERYCSLPTVTDHLQSLKAVGILSDDTSYINESGDLVSMYRITEYGMEKVQKASSI